jgi:hypothetical protein
VRIFREKNTRNRAELMLKWHQNSSKFKKLMRHTKQQQERGVHCYLWVQRLASSNSFKNKSTVITCRQWKK